MALAAFREGLRHPMFWLLTLAFCAAGIVLSILNRTTLNADPITLYSILILSALSFATVGSLIARRHPRNAIGWIFLGAGLLAALRGLPEAVYLKPQ